MNTSSILGIVTLCMSGVSLFTGILTLKKEYKKTSKLFVLTTTVLLLIGIACLIFPWGADTSLQPTPEELQIWYDKGSLLKNDEHYEQAIDYFDKILHGDLEYKDTRYKRAVCYQMTEKHELALKDFQKIIETDTSASGTWIAHYNSWAAQCLLDMGKNEEAIKYLNIAINIEQDASYFHQRMVANQRMGYHWDAANDIMMALAITQNPDSYKTQCEDCLKKLSTEQLQLLEKAYTVFGSIVSDTGG